MADERTQMGFLMRLLLLLVVTCQVSLLVWAQNEGAVVKIEQHLEKVDQEGSRRMSPPEALFDMAMELMKKKKGSSFKGLLGIGSSSSDSSRIVDFLTQLQQLRMAADLGDQCGRPTNDLRETLVSKVERATVSSVDGLLRVNSLVGYYARRLAKVCQSEYIRRFSTLSNQLANKEAEFQTMHLFLMEAIVRVLTDSRRTYRAAGVDGARAIMNYRSLVNNQAMRWRLVDRIIRTEQHIATNYNGKMAYLLLEHYVNSQYALAPDFKWSMGGEQTRDLFNVLIHQQCQEYMQIFGAHLFEVAQADVKYLDRGTVDQLGEAGAFDFYFNWAEYNLCWQIVYDDQEREALLDLIVKEAESRPNDDDDGGDGSDRAGPSSFS